MGHGHSRQKAEVEKIVREVNDIESFMKRNSEDFDDECRDNLHKRLIEYSTALQEILGSGTKKQSKELREVLDYINKVVEDIFKPRQDISSSRNSTIEAPISVHVFPKNTKLSASAESIDKENSRRNSRTKKRDLASHEKYRIPSLEEIKNKTVSLKSEVETNIRNDDLNQLLVQQKIIQILATDLEMLIYEVHSPLQETKEALEKDLSLLYRKIEKAKKKSSDAARVRQQNETRESINELSNMNTRVDQIMSLAHILIKENKYPELLKAREEVIGYKTNINSITGVNESIIANKIEVEQKLDKLLLYLNKEIEVQASKSNDIQNEKSNEEFTDDSSADVTKINQKIDQVICQGRSLVQERKFFELLDLKNQIMEERNKLEKFPKDSEETAELNHKINNTIEYLHDQMEINGVNKKIKKTIQNLERAEELIEECRSDITNFSGMTNKKTYETYNNHLDGLQSFLDKITVEEENITKKKSECMKKVTELRKVLKENFEKYNGRGNNKVSPDDIKNLNSSMNFVPTSETVDPTKYVEEEDVVMRKKVKPLKVQFTKDKNIDGFYIYWKDIQSNLPSSNCSYEELQQIAMLLQDLEEQIRAKRLVIENVWQARQEGRSITKSKEDLDKNSSNIFQNNKMVIDNIDSVVKTNVKIIKTDAPKKLIIDDEEIFQNIDEINKYAKKIEKQIPEKVFIASDNDSNNEIIGKQEENVKVKQEVKVIPSEEKEIKITQKQDPKESSKSSVTETKISHGNKNEDREFITKKQGQKNKQHVEYITQIQNISRDVEYLKEKAMHFTNMKQTPRYMDMKNRLESYRKTLNILISYQNESITSSCRRVIENIDEVIEILSKNTEKQTLEVPKLSTKRNTIETLFTDMMNIKADIEEIDKEIDGFQDAIENDKYVKLRNTLLKNREILTHMRISKNFENVAIARVEVLQQIEDALYNLTIKLEENKIRSKHDYCKRDSRIEKIVNDFKKIKDKVNRFSGTYKNVLYKEIEKSIEKSLQSARSITSDINLIHSLNEDAEMCLRILEEKSIKEYSHIDEETNTDNSINEQENKDKNIAFTEIAVQLSRMRQNLKDITENIYSNEPQNLESNKDLEHRINMNILELSSINITSDEPFYYDKENLRQEFLKLSTTVKDNIFALEGERPAGDGQSSSHTATLRLDKNDVEEELSNIEENVEYLRKQIDVFADEKNSVAFFNIDEALTKLSMNVDKLATKRGTDLHKKKVRILKTIYEFCETLENKAQSYEILHNIQKKMIEVKYRLENFHELSQGDYNALYKELVDLGLTLEQLNASDDILEKKNECQSNIQECLSRIENEISNASNTEDDSEGGTEV